MSYLALPLAQAGFSFGLLALVGIKGPRHRNLRSIFMVLLGALGVWGLLIYTMRASPNTDYALFWERTLLPLTILIPALYLHFVIRFAGTKANVWLLLGVYLVFTVSIPLFLKTDFFLEDVQVKSYGYAPVFGSFMSAPIVFSVALVITALVALAKYIGRSREYQARNRAVLILVGGSVALAGIVFDILPVFGLPLYPGFIIGNIIFCILTTIAILKYRLLDINLVLRKGVAYFLATSAFFFVVMMVWAFGISNFHHLFPVWLDVLLIAVFGLGLPPLWCFFQRHVDRLFYRERYDHLKALEDFSQQPHSLADEAAGDRIARLLAQAIRASFVHLLLPRQPDGDLVISFTTTPEAVSHIKLRRQSPVVQWFAEKGSLVSSKEIEIIPQFVSREREILREVGAELLVPVRREGQLSGLILIGKKLSAQPYSAEDEQVLRVFASQIGTKLENMALYADAVRMHHELQVLSRRLVEVQEEERRNIPRRRCRPGRLTA